jgi:hypothetical protein
MIIKDVEKKICTNGYGLNIIKTAKARRVCCVLCTLVVDPWLIKI